MITNVTTTNFPDTNVVDGTTYYYVVFGVNNDGEGPNSSEVNATPQPLPPAAPTGLAATAAISPGEIELDGFLRCDQLQRQASRPRAAGRTRRSPTSPRPPFTTPVSPPVRTYYYVVSAVNGIGESGDSLEATATPTSALPLVFDFENTGAGYSVTLPALPTPGTFANIYPLPDPFYWVSDPLNIGGTASTNFQRLGTPSR